MMVWELFDIKGGGILYLLVTAMMVSMPVSLAASSSLKLVSYNIHGGVGSDGKKDLERIALVLKAAVPDVVALNEVNRYFLGHKQDEEIAKAVGPDWRAIFGKTFTKPFADYGNAILTRLPIISSESWLLSDFPHQERRGLLRVTVEKEDAVYHIFAVHMGLNARMRERHSHEILKIMGQHQDGYCILMGDFNEQRSRSPGSAIANFAAQLKDCSAHYGLGPQVTFPSTRTFRRIDFIWINNALAATSCYVPSHPDARLASDHLPVVAKVLLPVKTIGSPASPESPGATYYQDFTRVPPSHIPDGWTLTGVSPKGGYIGGVAVIGNEHVWRQSSSAELQFNFRHKVSVPSSIEVSALIKTIATGGGRWSVKAKGLEIEVRHELGHLPKLVVTAGGQIIAEKDLPSHEIDPYDWNRYRLVLSNSDSTSGFFNSTVWVNGELLATTEMVPEDLTTLDFGLTTAGAIGPCEIYVDDVSIRQVTGQHQLAEEERKRPNHRVIELEEKSPSGWLDWW